MNLEIIYLRNRVKIARATIAVSVLLISFIIFHYYIAKTPLYALRNRLEEISTFETKLESFSFRFTSETKIEDFTIYEGQKKILFLKETPWKNVETTIIWSKEKGLIASNDFLYSPQEARDSFFFLNPSSVFKSIESHDYYLREYQDSGDIFTDIVIPFSKVSSDIFKSYERGADIVNSRKDEFREACFLGQVEGMDIRRVEERGSTIGGELIFTIHHGDWNISDITLTTPISITAEFTGKLCDSDVEIYGEYSAISQNIHVFIENEF